jgi:hypothetical protein
MSNKQKFLKVQKKDVDVLQDISKRTMVNAIALMMAIDIFVEERHMEQEVKRFQEIMRVFQDGIQTK